jgi:hypothetical protein
MLMFRRTPLPYSQSALLGHPCARERRETYGFRFRRAGPPESPQFLLSLPRKSRLRPFASVGLHVVRCCGCCRFFVNENQLLAEVIVRGVVATLQNHPPLSERLKVILPLPFFCIGVNRKKWLDGILRGLEGVVGVDFADPEPSMSGYTVTIAVTLRGELHGETAYILRVHGHGVSAWSAR